MLNSIIKVDLHIHSSASSYKDGKIVGQSDIGHLDSLLDKIDSNGINLFSFSDHNRFDKDLFVAAKEKIDSGKYLNIKNILPAVEFDVAIDDGKPSCHIIAVFDASSEEELSLIKGALQEDPLTLPSDFYSKDSFEKILRKAGLNVLLIGCQRKDLSNPSGGSNCVSDSCEKPLSFIQSGYINALEYQSSKVEGILINNLTDLPKDIGVSLIAGSDCHEWDAYPLHHKNMIAPKDKVYYFQIKALPSFMGLVLAFSAPQSRFKRTNREYKFIKSFTVQDKEYDLSNGINVIIGENGSGKSTLLNGIALGESNIKHAYMKRILKDNGFSVDDENLEMVKLVTQSQLIDNNNNEKSIFGNEVTFNRINNTNFEKAIHDYCFDILNKIESKISFTSKLNSLDKDFVFNYELDGTATYYVQIVESDNFSKTTNNYSDRLESINGILKTIKEEYGMDIYNDDEKRKLKEAFELITELKASISKKYLDAKAESMIKNIISSKIKDYNSLIDCISNTADSDKRTYNSGKQIFIDNILGTIREKNKYEEITIRKQVLNSEDGCSIVQDGGFDFVTKSKYNDVPDIFDELLKKLFVSDYQNEASLLEITTSSQLISAIRGASSIDNYKQKYKDNSDKFVEEFEKESYTIVSSTSKMQIGNTLGEKSIVFYRFITKKGEDKRIYVIDQPEDNISNPIIIAELIKYLSELRDKAQIIFATHNPLLVINLDVDNVIYLNNINGKLNIKNGCLEDKDILNVVADNMDGGRDAIRRRLKVYGN